MKGTTAMKWIKLLKDHSGHKAGVLLQVEEIVAKAYIDAGLAEDGGDGPTKAIEAIGLEELRKEMKAFGTGMGEVFKEATADLKKTFKIEPGPQQADKTKSLGDFVAHIVKAGDIRNLEQCQASQNRLAKEYGAKFGIQKGQEESSGGAGGFWTVPVEFEKTILMEQAENAVILPGVTAVPMGARAKEWPSLDQYQTPTNGNSAYFGGITVSRKGENTQRSQTQAAATKIKLEANDLTAYATFTRDDQQDSDGVVESMLTMLIGGAIGWRRDWEHMWGSGEGQPLGYIGCDAMLTQARAVALSVTWLDIAGMLKYLQPSSQKRAVFVAHPYLLQQFLTLTDPSGRYIYIPAFPGNQIGAAGINPSPMLANIPVLFTEKAAAPGNLGDFTLCDRKAILSGMRSGIELGLSEHFLFDTDQIALRAKVRDDAQPWLKKPIKLSDGSAGTNKVSAFIGLSTKLS
jgi:HK97 family phage major capsid protein